MKKTVLFILSVDTEEEWDWSGPFPKSNFSVENIYELPAFQNFCQGLGIKPTYFIDYAVANSTTAVNTIKQLNSELFEIGAHLHPWANPPFFESINEITSHVINLPIEQVEQKLDLLLEKLTLEFDCNVKSFRTGRWGTSGEVLNLLLKKEINTDSSVYPLFRSHQLSCEKAPSTPYWPNFDDPNIKGEQREILELPVTVSFNRRYNLFCQELHKLFEHRPFSWFRFNGILWHTKLLRKLYLSPELCSGKEMRMLIDTELKKDHSYFHMYLHSSSLLENVTGLSPEECCREYLCEQIKSAVEYLQTKANVKFCTISEARDLLTQKKKMN